MKLIILRGQMNAGKTTTCGKVYSELFDAMLEKEHWFKHRTVSTNSLQYNPTEGLIDFKAVLTIKRIKVGIISAGDIAKDLKRDIELMIRLKVDVLICCTRTHDRRGSSYRMIDKDFSETCDTLGIVHLPFSKENERKEENGNAAGRRVIELVNREIG